LGLHLGSQDVRKAYQIGPDTLSMQGTQPSELRSERHAEATAVEEKERTFQKEGRAS